MKYHLLVLRLESQPKFIPVRGGFDRVLVCNNNAILLNFLAQIVALVAPTVVKKINIISLHLVQKYCNLHKESGGNFGNSQLRVESLVRHLHTRVRGSWKKAAVVMAQSKPMGISVNVYVARAQSSNMEDRKQTSRTRKR